MRGSGSGNPAGSGVGSVTRAVWRAGNLLASRNSRGHRCRSNARRAGYESRVTSETNKQVALAFIDRVFMHGEASAVDELASEDFTAHTFGPKPVGRDFLKEAIP